MDPTISGTYKTKRDGGIEYTYEARWMVMPNGSAAWWAKVRLAGELRGEPNGQLLNTAGVDMHEWMRVMVERCIEDRLQIQ